MATASPVTFIAHRGESADAPENTLAAFRLAWERGDEAIELDVHLTRDGALIVCHDGNPMRTTGRDIAIPDATAAELQALDAGGWKGARWRGERMPLLSEVLAELPERRRCLIEVKAGSEAAPELARTIAACRCAPRQLTIISFNAEAVAAARRAMPDIDGYLLAGFARDGATGAWSPGPDALIREAERIGACALNLAARGPVDAAFVRRVKEAGLGAYVWTVDDEAAARRFVAAGVDGITSNRAAWLRERCAA